MIIWPYYNKVSIPSLIVCFLVRIIMQVKMRRFSQEMSARTKNIHSSYMNVRVTNIEKNKSASASDHRRLHGPSLFHSNFHRRCRRTFQGLTETGPSAQSLQLHHFQFSLSRTGLFLAVFRALLERSLQKNIHQ